MFDPPEPTEPPEPTKPPGPSDLDPTWEDEEPWESDIAALLASLPAVEPPTGFLERAIDHRPLFALRSTAALMAAACVVLAAAVRIGALERQGVVPPVAALVERHTYTEDALEHGDPLAVEEADSPPLSLPGAFHEYGHVEGEEPYQILFTSEEDMVSVFSQPGRVDWDALPSEGMHDIAGVPAWVDADHELVLVETADSAVIIVGLAPNELAGTLQSLPRRSKSLFSQVRDGAVAVSCQLGFADLE